MQPLLGVGFRHQDHEFVAAIPCDHIRAAAALLERFAETLENQIAFQVSLEVVDEFESVHVDQRQRERPSRPRRALPFRRKRVHEEAMGFHAGQAVGDGLFLGFLERQRVMQRARDQVRERVQQ